MEYVLHNIKPAYLSQMRRPGPPNETKTIDVRVPDPKDKLKRFERLKENDYVLFVDTRRDALRVRVKFVRHYASAEELIRSEGAHNVWPGCTLEEAVERCLQFPGYRERVSDYGIYAIGFTKLVGYVSGPYSSPDPRVRARNVENSRRVGVALAKLGYLAFTPNQALEGWERYGLGYEGCLALELDWIGKVDFFYFIGPSKGAIIELAETLKQSGMPIFSSLERLRKWLPEVIA